MILGCFLFRRLPLFTNSSCIDTHQHRLTHTHKHDLQFFQQNTHTHNQSSLLQKKMRSNTFSRSLSALFLLHVTVSSHIRLTSSVKVPAPASAPLSLPFLSDKQDSCSVTNPCETGFICLSTNGVVCSINDFLCLCGPTDVVCSPNTPCTNGKNCMHRDNTACNDYNRVCLCGSGQPEIPSSSGGGGWNPFRSPQPQQPPPSSVNPGGFPNPTPTQDADDDDDDVCVDAALLKHLPRERLVYRKDRRASVLCDEMGSCATAGHMVTFKGQAMMMMSYCQVTGMCKQRVMNVNSPVMSRNVRVPTKTDGLQFTAFASRYRSVVEERLLAAIVHMSV